MPKNEINMDYILATLMMMIRKTLLVCNGTSKQTKKNCKRIKPYGIFLHFFFVSFFPSWWNDDGSQKENFHWIQCGIITYMWHLMMINSLNFLSNYMAYIIIFVARTEKLLTIIIIINDSWSKKWSFSMMIILSFFHEILTYFVGWS